MTIYLDILARSIFKKGIFIYIIVIELVGLVQCFNNFGVADRVIEARCTIVSGRLNKLYTDTVSRERPLIFTFHLPKRDVRGNHNTNLRVEVGTTHNTSLRYPILFSVQQQRYINTLEVPRQFSLAEVVEPGRSSNMDMPFYTAARTLCIDNYTERDKDGRNITVRVTTQSENHLNFYVVLKLTYDFQLPIGKEVTFQLTPTTPIFYGFTFSRPDMRQVKIRASSPSTTCMTISVQSVHCPVYDSVHNVRYKGLWQTMSTTAAMSVQKMGWYAEGFVLVFVVHANSRMCGRNDIFFENKTEFYSTHERDLSIYSANEIDPKSKTVHLLITNESSISGWIIALCLFLPIIVTFLISFAVLLLFRNRHEWMAEILKKKFSNPLISQNESNGNGNTRENAEDDTGEERSAAGSSSFGIKWKADRFIGDFNCKTYEEVAKFSKRFYWTIGIVAIFYSIPVYQLVVHYLRVLYRTGEYDICYYNYLCAQRLGVLIDFNHFWSNASYVIFGILFIAIVRQRSSNLCLPHKWRDHVKDEEQNDKKACGCTCCPNNRKGGVALCLCGCRFTKVCFHWDHGVPGHFGVFYALGVALTMEGFLSAAYHLCPNQSTFQFDTCFMYVIAVLLLLKIYQFRHPVHFGANQTFAILAGFVFTSVLGLLFERGTETAVLLFKVIFVIIQFIIMIVIFIYNYAVGYIKNERNEQITDYTIFSHLGQLKSQKINGDRLILPAITFTICIAVLVYSQLSNIEFASYLLYILVGNVLGTTIYYVGIMKPLHGEFKNRTWVQPTLYFVAAAVIGGFSMQYFLRAPAQWELSASASRTKNEDCLGGWFPFHPFYDSHDAWHFLSAAALFLAFMGLLIVDDDLITTPQSKIHVF